MTKLRANWKIINSVQLRKTYSLYIEIKMETRCNRPRERLLLLLLKIDDFFFFFLTLDFSLVLIIKRYGDKSEKGMSSVLICHVLNYYNTASMGKYFDLFSRFTWTFNYTRQWLIYYICMK